MTGKPSFAQKLHLIGDNDDVIVISHTSIDSVVSGLGDINYDGFDDFAIGQWIDFIGITFVIYGSSDLSNFKLIDMTSEQGFTISGESDTEEPVSVSGAGDVNNDGYDDIIVGFQGSDLNAGITYVIFGKPSLLSDIKVSSLTISQGFSITRASENSNSGHSISGGGDVNGDGYDDIVIGAPYSSDFAGAVYVVYGRAGDFTNVYLGDNIVDNYQGYAIYGAYSGDLTGSAVSIAGDVNGDGLADVLIGAPDANLEGGISYLILSVATPTSAPSFMPTDSLTIEVTMYDAVRSWILSNIPSVSVICSAFTVALFALLRKFLAFVVLDFIGHKYKFISGPNADYITLRSFEIGLLLKPLELEPENESYPFLGSLVSQSRSSSVLDVSNVDVKFVVNLSVNSSKSDSKKSSLSQLLDGWSVVILSDNENLEDKQLGIKYEDNLLYCLVVGKDPLLLTVRDDLSEGISDELHSTLVAACKSNTSFQFTDKVVRELFVFTSTKGYITTNCILARNNELLGLYARRSDKNEYGIDIEVVSKHDSESRISGVRIELYSKLVSYSNEIINIPSNKRKSLSLTQNEKNQLRNYLYDHQIIRSDDLGYVCGNLYNIALIYRDEHTEWYKMESISICQRLNDLWLAFRRVLLRIISLLHNMCKNKHTTKDVELMSYTGSMHNNHNSLNHIGISSNSSTDLTNNPMRLSSHHDIA